MVEGKTYLVVIPLSPITEVHEESFVAGSATMHEGISPVRVQLKFVAASFEELAYHILKFVRIDFSEFRLGHHHQGSVVRRVMAHGPHIGFPAVFYTAVFHCLCPLQLHPLPEVCSRSAWGCQPSSVLEVQEEFLQLF